MHKLVYIVHSQTNIDTDSIHLHSPEQLDRSPDGEVNVLHFQNEEYETSQDHQQIKTVRKQ